MALCKFGHKKLDISKIILARNFKLDQFIEDNEQTTCWKFKKKSFFLSYCPLQIFDIETLIYQKPLQLGALNLDSW